MISRIAIVVALTAVSVVGGMWIERHLAARSPADLRRATAFEAAPLAAPARLGADDRRAIADEVTRAVVAQLRRAPIATDSAASTNATNPPSAPAPLGPPADPALLQSGLDLVDTAVARHMLNEQDLRSLQDIVMRLPGEQKGELLTPFFKAVNSGQITVTTHGPLFSSLGAPPPAAP